jgi:putative flippase GtrA
VRHAARHSATRFLAVGIVSYGFDLGVLAALHSGLGMPLALATTLAFLSTLALNFGLNKAFAFRSRALAGPAFVRYLILVAVNYATTLIMVTGLAWLGLSYVVAKTLAVVVNAVMNYFAYRHWVFQEKSTRPHASGTASAAEDF